MPEKTLLIGATAGTGYEVAQKLLAAKQPIRLIARNQAKAEKLFGKTDAEIIICDLTMPNEAFLRAFHGVDTIVFTAAVPPGFAKEELIRTVDYGGVVAAVEAAKKADFKGRFLYMSTIGLQHKNLMMRMLNWYKTNLIHWRLESERAVIKSGLSYTIIRAGMLRNTTSGQKPVQLIKEDLPIQLSTQISRADVADLLITCAQEKITENQIVSAIWGGDGLPVTEQMKQLFIA